MTRSVRVAASAIGGTPVLMVMFVMLVFIWIGAAEIYATLVWARGASGYASTVLVSMNAVCSCVLVFHLAGLLDDLRELRLPKYRQVRVGGLIVVLALVLLAPCLLVWLVDGGMHGASMAVTGSVLGTAGALLCRLCSRARHRSGARTRVAAVAAQGRNHVPQPWLAVRVALGSPYAPASWQWRLIQLVSLCAIVALAPALVLFYRQALSARGFTVLLRAAEIVGFLPAIALCWLWPMMRLIAVLDPGSAAATELALLPGLGSGGQQLRRLFLVAASLPVGALIVLLIIALRLVALEHLPHAVYTKLALQFLLISLLTVPGVISRISKPRESAGLMAMVFPQVWVYSFLVWTDAWGALKILPVLWRWLAVAIVLMGLMIPLGMSILWLRKLLQRPHPFVEMPS